MIVSGWKCLLRNRVFSRFHVLKLKDLGIVKPEEREKEAEPDRSEHVPARAPGLCRMSGRLDRPDGRTDGPIKLACLAPFVPRRRGGPLSPLLSPLDISHCC